MRRSSKVRPPMLAAVLTLLSAAGAQAACSLPGVWFYYEGRGDGGTRYCTMTIAANGNITAPCTFYLNNSNVVESSSESGAFTVSIHCRLSGSFTRTAGGPTTTIKHAHINGNNGAGIVVQNQKQYQFTMVKK
jgi:hypothetical protein